MKTMLRILSLLFATQAYASDFTINVTAAPNSITDTEVQQISSSKIQGLGPYATKPALQDTDIPSILSSKISDFASAISSAVASSLNNYLLKSDIKAPTVRKLSSSGLYTTPAGVLYLRVKMQGGGGGGGGSGSATPGSGQPGGAATFADMIAGGGTGGGWADRAGGQGGNFNFGSFSLTSEGLKGSAGGGATGTGSRPYDPGGIGGTAGCGGGGGGGASLPGDNGGGGGGGTIDGTGGPGAGGGGGACIIAIIKNPASSYLFGIPAISSGGSAGPSGNIGGSGGLPSIIVEEYYQ